MFRGRFIVFVVFRYYRGVKLFGNKFSKMFVVRGIMCGVWCLVHEVCARFCDANLKRMGNRKEIPAKKQ